MASLTQWTWIWVNSGSWWWTGRPGMLQSVRSQSRTWLSWTESWEVVVDIFKKKNFFFPLSQRPSGLSWECSTKNFEGRRDHWKLYNLLSVLNELVQVMCSINQVCLSCIFFFFTAVCLSVIVKCCNIFWNSYFEAKIWVLCGSLIFGCHCF